VQDLVRIQQARADAAAAAAFQSRVNAAMSAAASDPSLIDPNLPAPTQRIATVLGVARQQLGKPYVWGAVGPDSFDCSGFTGYAYAAAGIALPRTAAQQYLAGSHPRLTQLLPGDLLFWATNLNDASSIDHMAMYLGNGLMIVAPHTGDIVKIQRVYSDGYFGATRVNPAISGSVAGPQWATFAGK
jgi:cell wall-associated NlpC family hydrolase